MTLACNEPPLSAHPLDCFDRVYVINLASRVDRRKQMRDEFDRIGYRSSNLEWFVAVRPHSAGPFPSIGAHGCFMSHLGILNRAARAGWNSILIFEDDVDFAPDFLARMATIVTQLQEQPWDVFYGGGQIAGHIEVEPGLARITHDTAITCTHCVAFRAPAIDRVGTYLRAQLGRPAGHSDGGPMHVDGSYSWARRELSLETLFAHPNICRQRPSRSDVASHSNWENAGMFRPVIELLRSIKRRLQK